MRTSFIPGRVVGGRYEILSKLGAGGVGSVWLAKDNQLGITVAVKELHHDVAAKKDVQEKFAREAELSARMLSPNIVRVLARGVDADGTPHIVYELLEGEDLGRRLERDDNIDFAETESVVVQVARALSRAHAVGVVHRDIKPANVFLTKDEDGRTLAKVLDFGVAELLANVASSEEITGTAEYMAPEVLIDGKAPEVRTDLYALTVLAYRCLTGRVPFQGDNLAQLMVAINATTPPKVSECLGVETLPELDAWFEIGLAREASYRFTTARELAESFHSAIKEAKRIAPEVSGAPSESARETRSTTTDRFDAKKPPQVSLRPKPLRVQPTPHPPPPPPKPKAAPRPPPPPKPEPRPPPVRGRAASFVFDEEELKTDPGARALTERKDHDPPTGQRPKLPSVVEVDATKPSKDDRRH